MKKLERYFPYTIATNVFRMSQKYVTTFL